MSGLCPISRLRLARLTQVKTARVLPRLAQPLIGAPRSARSADRAGARDGWSLAKPDGAHSRSGVGPSGRSPDRESSVLARLEQVKTVRVLARLEQVKTVRVLATCAAELRRCSPRWQDSGGVHLREWWQDSGGVHRPE